MTLLAATCPACGAKVTFRTKPEIAATITCSSCEATLEVVDNDPLELDWLFDEDEEFDYDEMDAEGYKYDDDLDYDEDEEAEYGAYYDDDDEDELDDDFMEDDDE